MEEKFHCGSPMILDLDIGNTRTKWALSESDASRCSTGCFLTKDIGQVMSVLPVRSVTRVRAASVVHKASSTLQSWVQSELDRAVEFAVVEDGCGGLTCGYREPERLGVDRWLALLAANARRSGQENFVVIDAGSALTVDICLATGQHCGGYIAPGLHMMIEALGVQTSGVGLQEISQQSLAPGSNTAEAVNNACLAACVGVIRNALEQLRVDHVFLTGGDRHEIESLLSVGMGQRLSLVPDLVLEGLHVALP